MSNVAGFRYKLELSEITTNQINLLIDKTEKKLSELKLMIANDLHPTGAELILFKIFEEIEYDHAVMTDNQDVLNTFQTVEDK